MSVYPNIEWEDVVLGYLTFLYRKTGRPVTARFLASAMISDTGEYFSKQDLEYALGSLEDKYLIERQSGGYILPSLGRELKLQLEMPEVEPFTREYGDVPAAHRNGTWEFSPMEELTKSKEGKVADIIPTSHYFIKDKRWEGLIQEDT